MKTGLTVEGEQLRGILLVECDDPKALGKGTEATLRKLADNLKAGNAPALLVVPKGVKVSWLPLDGSRPVHPGEADFLEWREALESEDEP